MLKKNWVLISVVVVVLMVGVAADIFFWKHIAGENQQRQDQWQNNLSALSAKVSQQQTDLTQLENKLSQLMRTNQRSAEQQTLNEVAYLLDVANLYLQINHDPVNAVKSLRLAQHSVQTLPDSALLPLQRALASDLNRLQDTQPLNTAETLLKLQTLSESISRLPMIPQPGTPSTLTTEEVSQPTRSVWYQPLWEALKTNFKNIVVIRYRSGAESPILPPQQRDWIRENTAFNIALAQWAVLREQPAVYQRSLAQVRQDLTTNYPDTPERKKILGRLMELIATDISPRILDINTSLRAVQQALKELSPTDNNSPTPTSPPPLTPGPPQQQPSTLPPNPASPGIEI